MIEVKKIKKEYSIGDNHLVVLDEISIKLEKSNIITILGPSGSGKTTLLNIMSGLDRSNSGEVLINGTDIEKLNDYERTMFRRNEIGFIYQSYNLIQDLTVYENIELGYNLGDKKINIDELIDNLGLKDQIKKFPTQLSGGQQQRVSIARAFAKNPKILFCDELTGALDETTAREILVVLKKLQEKYKTTVIIVTHNIGIGQMSDVVLKLHGGNIKDVIYNEIKKDPKDIEWA